MDWHQLWEIASAPDNVPIVAMLFLIPFYLWYALRQGIANDKLIAILEVRPAAGQNEIPQNARVESEVGAGSPHLAVPDAHGISGRHYRHGAAHGLVAHAERAARRAVESERDHEPCEGSLVFPRLQEMLVYFDPWIAGVVMPTLMIVGLMVIPYIDANPLGTAITPTSSGAFRSGRFCSDSSACGWLMIVIGTFIRGPGWMWFWPGRTWDAAGACTTR